MPTLRYKAGMPSLAQFQTDLHRVVAVANPIDDLIELAYELRDFEQK
jgi:hypothetical protein